MIALPEVSPNDTVAWRNNKPPHLRCWGLVRWVDAEGVHVFVSTGRRQIPSTIALDRITQVWTGRQMFDRRGCHYS